MTILDPTGSISSSICTPLEPLCVKNALYCQGGLTGAKVKLEEKEEPHGGRGTLVPTPGSTPTVDAISTQLVVPTSIRRGRTRDSITNGQRQKGRQITSESISTQSTPPITPSTPHGNVGKRQERGILRRKDMVRDHHKKTDQI